jgi:hypothetical protein
MESREKRQEGLSDNERYVLEKIEKLARVFYIVTKGFPSDEPLRVTLRRSALTMMSFIKDIKDNGGYGITVIREGYLREMATLVPALTLCSDAGYFPQANVAVLKNELISLDQFLRQAGDAAFVESFNLVQVPTLSSQASVPVPSRQSQSGASKETSLSSKSTIVRPGAPSALERRNQVLERMQSGVEHTIRDIADSLPNWSEKTIQRELASLVAEGVVEKKGERRWSTYKRA